AGADCSGASIPVRSWRYCARGRGRAAKACSQSKAVGAQRLHNLPGRREEVQVAEKAFAQPPRAVARTVSRKMEPAGGLPHGGSRLRCQALGSCQADGPWAQGAGGCSKEAGLAQEERLNEYIQP